MESTSANDEEHFNALVSQHMHKEATKRPPTLREIYGKLNALQSENFDLKLRLYHRNECEKKKRCASSEQQLAEAKQKLESLKSTLAKCRCERKDLEDSSRQQIEKLQQQLDTYKGKLVSSEQELNTMKAELKAVMLGFFDEEDNNSIEPDCESSLVTLSRHYKSQLSVIEEETTSKLENNSAADSQSEPMPVNDLSWQELLQQLRLSSLLAKQLKVRQNWSLLRLKKLLVTKQYQAADAQPVGLPHIEAMPCLQLTKSIPDWTAESHDQCCTSLQRALCGFDGSLDNILIPYAQVMDWRTPLNLDGQLRKRQLKRVRKFLLILMRKFKSIECSCKVHLIRSEIKFD